MTGRLRRLGNDPTSDSGLPPDGPLGLTPERWALRSEEPS
jgi:hypothetical protein